MELLVVMSGLSGGGAEKSLVSFLATLQKTHAKDVNVDLLVFRPECFCLRFPKMFIGSSNRKNVFA